MPSRWEFKVLLHFLKSNIVTKECVWEHIVVWCEVSYTKMLGEPKYNQIQILKIQINFSQAPVLFLNSELSIAAIFNFLPNLIYSIHGQVYCTANNLRLISYTNCQYTCQEAVDCLLYIGQSPTRNRKISNGIPCNKNKVMTMIGI